MQTFIENNILNILSQERELWPAKRLMSNSLNNIEFYPNNIIPVNIIA